MTYRIVLLFLWFSIATTGQEPFRNWTDIKGRTVSARFIKFLDSKVIIERESDSRKMPFPISQLSANDQDHLTKLKAKEAVKASKSLKSNDYKGMLLRKKKWTNLIGGSLQRFFFAFKLEKIDADGDGLPEGNKVILQQLWFAGREAVLNSKVIAEQACTGTWTVDDSGKLEIRLLKCYPEDNVAIGFYTGGPTNLRYWIGAGYSPRTLCAKRHVSHTHTPTCGCPFTGSGIWNYDSSSGSFKGISSNDSWRASIYPMDIVVKMTKN